MRKKSLSKVSECERIAEENSLLLREGTKIVEALGRMFAPACEVVLHDLLKPGNAILAIENPISGRSVGEPTTEMGLARTRDPLFPDIVQNYQNTLPDGRAAKSTSIGLRNSRGDCVAAICLNLDITPFETIQRVLAEISRTDKGSSPVKESFRARSVDDLREEIFRYSAHWNTSPRLLTAAKRHQLVGELSRSKLLHMRGAIGVISELLAVSRGSIYNSIKRIEA